MMRWLIGGILAVLAILGVLMVLRPGMSAGSGVKPRGDPVTVVGAGSPVSIAPPVASPVEAGAVRPQENPTQDAPILHALALPAGTALRNLATVDPAQRVVCGEVAAPPTAPDRRFVYLRVAGLAAIDDGSAEFARMRERLCARSAAPGE